MIFEVRLFEHLSCASIVSRTFLVGLNWYVETDFWLSVESIDFCSAFSTQGASVISMILLLLLTLSSD